METLRNIKRLLGAETLFISFFTVFIVLAGAIMNYELLRYM